MRTKGSPAAREQEAAPPSRPYVNQSYAERGGSFSEIVVEGRERDRLTLRQFKIAGVIDREPVLARKRQNCGLLGRAVDHHAEPGQLAQKYGRVGFAQPAAALIDNQRVANF